MRTRENNYFKKIIAAVLALGIFVSCSDDDSEPVPFDQPTIAVTSDNDQPFQGDVVTFNITVNAPGGLQSVTLNDTEIKSYNGTQTEDNFTYEYAVGEDATVGPIALSFEVTDAQTPTLINSFSSSVTIQNADFRGSPLILADFQGDGNIAGITFDSGPNSWEAAFSTDVNAEDPENAANTALRANRLGATDWYFQGFGAVFVDFNSFLSEDEMLAVFNGERVLQMNVFVQENEKIVNGHTNPDDIDNNRLDYDASWTFERFYTENANAMNAWDFETQDSVQSIPIRIEVGNAGSWDYNNGDPLGKKFFLVGSVTSTNTWQTVTFNLLRNAGTEEELELVVNPTGSDQQNYSDDPAIGFDQINRFALMINSRVSSYNNLDGVFQRPGDGNGWSSDTPVGIADDHNSYFFDNIRIIDLEEYNNNPNE